MKHYFLFFLLFCSYSGSCAELIFGTNIRECSNCYSPLIDITKYLNSRNCSNIEITVLVEDNLSVAENDIIVFKILAIDTTLYKVKVVKDNALYAAYSNKKKESFLVLKSNETLYKETLYNINPGSVKNLLEPLCLLSELVASDSVRISCLSNDMIPGIMLNSIDEDNLYITNRISNEIARINLKYNKVVRTEPNSDKILVKSLFTSLKLNSADSVETTNDYLLNPSFSNKFINPTFCLQTAQNRVECMCTIKYTTVADENEKKKLIEQKVIKTLSADKKVVIADNQLFVIVFDTLLAYQEHYSIQNIPTSYVQSLHSAFMKKENKYHIFHHFWDAKKLSEFYKDSSSIGAVYSVNSPNSMTYTANLAINKPLEFIRVFPVNSDFSFKLFEENGESYLLNSYYPYLVSFNASKQYCAAKDDVKKHFGFKVNKNYTPEMLTEFVIERDNKLLFFIKPLNSKTNTIKIAAMDKATNRFVYVSNWVSKSETPLLIPSQNTQKYIRYLKYNKKEACFYGYKIPRNFKR